MLTETLPRNRTDNRYYDVTFCGLYSHLSLDDLICTVIDWKFRGASDNVGKFHSLVESGGTERFPTGNTTMECLNQWYGGFRKTKSCQDLSAKSEISNFKSRNPEEN